MHGTINIKLENLVVFILIIRFSEDEGSRIFRNTAERHTPKTTEQKSEDHNCSSTLCCSHNVKQEGIRYCRLYAFSQFISPYFPWPIYFRFSQLKCIHKIPLGGAYLLFPINVLSTYTYKPQLFI